MFHYIRSVKHRDKCSRLLNRAAYRRKYVIRVSADQTDGADNDHQNHCKHDSVLGDVLTTIVIPQTAKETCHFCPLIANHTAAGLDDPGELNIYCRLVSFELPDWDVVLSCDSAPAMHLCQARLMGRNSQFLSGKIHSGRSCVARQDSSLHASGCNAHRNG
jgi:hypothetical protein